MFDLSKINEIFGSWFGRSKNVVSNINETDDDLQEELFPQDRNETNNTSWNNMVSIHKEDENKSNENKPITSDAVDSLSSNGWLKELLSRVQKSKIHNTNLTQTSTIEPPVNQAPVNQTPVNETPVNSTPVNQTPANETPVNQTPVNQTPVEPVAAGEIGSVEYLLDRVNIPSKEYDFEYDEQGRVIGLRSKNSTLFFCKEYDIEYDGQGRVIGLSSKGPEGAFQYIDDSFKVSYQDDRMVVSHTKERVGIGGIDWVPTVSVSAQKMDETAVYDNYGQLRERSSVYETAEGVFAINEKIDQLGQTIKKTEFPNGNCLVEDNLNDYSKKLYDKDGNVLISVPAIAELVSCNGETMTVKYNDVEYKLTKGDRLFIGAQTTTLEGPVCDLNVAIRNDMDRTLKLYNGADGALSKTINNVPIEGEIGSIEWAGGMGNSKFGGSKAVFYDEQGRVILILNHPGSESERGERIEYTDNGAEKKKVGFWPDITIGEIKNNLNNVDKPTERKVYDDDGNFVEGRINIQYNENGYQIAEDIVDDNGNIIGHVVATEWDENGTPTKWENTYPLEDGKVFEKYENNVLRFKTELTMVNGEEKPVFRAIYDEKGKFIEGRTNIQYNENGYQTAEDIIDANGNIVGHVVVTEWDENGNPTKWDIT